MDKKPTKTGMDPRLLAMSRDDVGDENASMTIIFAGGRAAIKQLRTSRLVVTDGPDKGLSVTVDRPRVTGGRSAVNDLVITDKAVSGAHFEILSREDGYLLKDLESTNGTFVGGVRIREVYLKPGTKFQVGHTVIRFQPTDEMVEIALSSKDRFGKALGRSVPMREVFAVLERVAPSDLTVLISGETGTGKDVIAQGIHEKSDRRKGPFVVLDCSAIPRNLIESTLFGHEKGAFTGAVDRRQGFFEQADGGTIFLDEIGELDLGLQPKLLRVLENKEIKRVGGHKTIGVDVRVIAATNRDLRKMVSDGTFREDLYFRLSLMHVALPPLRNRVDDVPLLARHFLEMVEKRRGVSMSFAPETLALLKQHDWPGNVRELRNVVERAASLADGPVIQPEDILWGHPITGEGRSAGSAAMPMGELDPKTMASTMLFKDAKQKVVDLFEKEYLTALMAIHTGNITRASEQAGLTRYHLRELLKKHGLHGPKE